MGSFWWNTMCLCKDSYFDKKFAFYASQRVAISMGYGIPKVRLRRASSALVDNDLFTLLSLWATASPGRSRREGLCIVTRFSIQMGRSSSLPATRLLFYSKSLFWRIFCILLLPSLWAFQLRVVFSRHHFFPDRFPGIERWFSAG